MSVYNQPSCSWFGVSLHLLTTLCFHRKILTKATWSYLKKKKKCTIVCLFTKKLQSALPWKLSRVRKLYIFSPDYYRALILETPSRKCEINLSIQKPFPYELLQSVYVGCLPQTSLWSGYYYRNYKFLEWCL